MLAKLKRSQRSGGLTGSVAIFCLDARVDLTANEQADIKRYKLGGQIIYTSEARNQAARSAALAGMNAQAQGISTSTVDTFLESTTSTIGHGLRAVALGAMAHLNLKITIDSLARGHHIECKSLDELLGAEEAVLSACENLNGYLLTAATFDGREIVIEFTPTGPVRVADATPAPALLMAPQAPSPGPMPPTHQPEPEIRAVAEQMAASAKIYAPTHASPDAMPLALRQALAEARRQLQQPGTRAILFVLSVPLSALLLNMLHMPVLLTTAVVLGMCWFAFRAVREVL